MELGIVTRARRTHGLLWCTNFPMIHKNVDRYIHSYSIKKLIIKPIPYVDYLSSKTPAKVIGLRSL